MATIQITIKNEFQFSFRQYQVFIDDEKLGTLENNETKNFTIKPKRYRMFVKIGWCSSPMVTFNLVDGETKCIQVEGAIHKGWWFKIFLCVIFLEFVYMGFTDTNFSGLSFIPLVLYYLYYLTFGRDEYLIVTVIK